MAVRKILLLEDLARRLEPPRRDGRKIVHCHGCFDLQRFVTAVLA